MDEDIKPISSMKVQCLWCGEILESATEHNMIWCKCGKTGLDYHPIWPRIAFIPKGDNPMYKQLEVDKNANR